MQPVEKEGMSHYKKIHQDTALRIGVLCKMLEEVIDGTTNVKERLNLNKRLKMMRKKQAMELELANLL